MRTSAAKTPLLSFRALCWVHFHAMLGSRAEGEGAGGKLLGVPLVIKLTYIFTGNTLWLFNVAIENGPFIDDLPVINGDFL